MSETQESATSCSNPGRTQPNRLWVGTSAQGDSGVSSLRPPLPLGYPPSPERRLAGPPRRLFESRPLHHRQCSLLLSSCLEVPDRTRSPNRQCAAPQSAVTRSPRRSLPCQPL